MGYNNRYFLFQNKFNPYMITANVPYLGGTGTGDIYLKIPLLLVSKYKFTANYNAIVNGVCYFLKERNKPCIVFNGEMRQVLPSQSIAYQNFNDKPLYVHYPTGDVCFYGKIRKSKADNDLKNAWILWDLDSSETPLLSYSNASFAGEEDWDGYYANNQDWRSTKDVGYTLGTDGDDPVLGTRYPLYAAYVAYDNDDKSYSYTSMFEFGNESSFYYRAEDAIDITPQHLKQTDFDLAGKWTATYNPDVNKVFIGMPIFEFTGGSESIKMIPVNEEQKSEVKYIDNEDYPLYKDSVTTSITRLMTGYDNDFNYSHMYITKNHYNGTQWEYTREYYYLLGYENKDSNGGYWRSDATSTKQYADEEAPPSPLTWISLDNETNKPDLSCEYIGSTLEPNILYKYEKRYPTAYKHMVIKNLSQNYHYDVEENK